MQISKKNGVFCISAVWTAPFIIHLLESIISELYTSEDSIFWLVSVAEQAGLSLALSENPKADFAASWISVCAVCLCPQNDADQSLSIIIIIRFFWASKNPYIYYQTIRVCCLNETVLLSTQNKY